MKHLTSLLLAVFVVFSCFSPVFAEKMDLSDLSTFGILPMKGERAENVPTQDGKILSGEYPLPHVSDEKSGLAVVSSYENLLIEKAEKLKPVQESYLSLDDKYIYCGLRLKMNTEEAIGVYKKNLGYVYPVLFSISLSSGNHPANRCSFLSNTYYFSAETGECVGVSGERIARSVENDTEIACRISNVGGIHYNEAYKDENDVLWNADYYEKHAAFRIEKESGVTVITAEILLPIGDALLSVPASERSLVADQLQKRKETLCGSFLSQVGVFASGDKVVLGLPTAQTYSVLQEGGSLKEYLKENYETPKSGLFLPDFLPIPLCFFCKNASEESKKTVEKSETESFVSNSKGENQGHDASTAKSSEKSPPVSNEATSFEKITKTEKESVFPEKAEENEILSSEQENDESVFDYLPGEGDVLPEETEILYLSQSEKNSSESEGSLLGSTLTFLAGVFLFAAMIVLVFFVRERSGEKKDSENKPKSSKKAKKG